MGNKVALGQTIVDADSLTEERDTDNFYPTPIPFIRWLLHYCIKNPDLSDFWSIDEEYAVLDVGLGTGNWGYVLSGLGFKWIEGVDLNIPRYADMENYHQLYDVLIHADVMKMHDRHPPYRFICGNPPYQRRTKTQPSTADIVQRCLSDGMLHRHGVALFLLPSNFSHTVDRWERFFCRDSGRMPSAVINLANRINFKTEDGKGGSYPGEYSVYIWSKRNMHNDHYKTYTAYWQ